MRIIAGKFKGRQISFPKHIRPTQDKVRQSLFDFLAQVVPGSRILDLFCGSGALGLEGASRGAREVIFVDIDQRCVSVVYENIDGLGLGKSEGARVSCFRQDAWRAIRVLEKKRQDFDLVLADPPYHKGLAKKALLSLGGSAIVAPRGFVVLEHSTKDDLGLPPQGWALLKKVCYGDKALSFFKKTQSRRVRTAASAGSEPR